MRPRLAIPLLALTLLSALGPRTPAQTPKCGADRWNVKVLRDSGAATLVRQADATTITALTGMPRETDPPQNGRASLERRVFRVRGIILEQRPVQADGDVHLVLGDPADRTRFLVAEIPDSACAVGSRYASDFAEARRTFVGMPVGVEVEVEGVAFWDDDHGQSGAAANGIELHPVLKIVPVLNRNDLLRTELGADPVVAQEIRVWLNTASKVYHCPGTAYYGKTSRGEYLTESAAVRAGARPAGGKRCA